MKNRPIHERAAFSLAGLRAGWARERSFRTHAACSAAALLALAALRPSPAWYAIVLLALAVGLALELLNGAVEAALDRLHPGRDLAIGIAKDMASAAAFVVNAAAAAVVALALATHA